MFEQVVRLFLETGNARFINVTAKIGFDIFGETADESVRAYEEARGSCDFFPGTKLGLTTSTSINRLNSLIDVRELFSSILLRAKNRIKSLRYKLLRQPLSGSEHNAFGHLFRHAHEW